MNKFIVCSRYRYNSAKHISPPKTWDRVVRQLVKGGVIGLDSRKEQVKPTKDYYSSKGKGLYTVDKVFV